MNILLSNDDGFFAPGINELYDHLSKIAEVTVVAPDRNRSGASNSLTLDQPIRAQKTERGFFSVTGTPTDCVHLGTHHLMQQAPDMVVAGINTGANLGDDALYSGTIAAAMEGRALGYTAVAISLNGHHCSHYETAARVSINIIQKLIEKPLAKNRVININVPDLPYEKIKGFKLTRLGNRHRADTIIPAKDPKGRDIYWIGPQPEGQDVGEGTDFHAVENGYVSITPINVDLTAYNSFDEVEDFLKQF
ncbi:5'/3'-nucleotidase SurE [Kangiella sp. HZ709]|uniref:5'/3'-nucleotidase SurE n=1 Tax=Kangiella sp. HZ709 TaxID=2666328 RepID=UPI0012AF6535|nr:5'/3'-nucleotidase SurE [Kangiella sp. HZ709]MRX28376.1 5'/3'-nucleotidase SurE [Kangiella sp. HZ709]